MAINIYPKSSTQLPNYLILFLIQSNQVGIGILGFQRIIVKAAGHNAILSVILAGLFTHLTMFVMVKTLRRYPSADIWGIQVDVFGKYIGTLFNWVYIFYFLFSAIIVLRNYIEIIQTWMFPEVSTWTFSAIILFLGVYTVRGGIRVIAGYTFISVILTSALLGTMFFPLEYARWIYLLPLYTSDLHGLLKGAMVMALTLSGFEIFYILYPFAKEKQSIGKYAQWALFCTNVLYLIFIIATQVFFSHDQLMKTIWASLTMEKMVHFSFLERFEYISISIWLFVIMPNLMLFLWCASRGVKRLYGWNQRRTVIVMTVLIMIVTLVPDTRQQINALNDYFSKVSSYITFLYPFILYLFVVVKQMWQKRKDGNAVEGSTVTNEEVSH